jgi:hypothetical protein
MTTIVNTLEQEILNLEWQVWEALVSGDADVDAASLADSFLGIYSDGFAVKADHVGQLAENPTVADYELSQTHFRTLGPDHCVLSYCATFVRAGHTASEVMYVTSIWEQSDGTWCNILSQDTPAL